ncbi:TPA: hypothetical protein ACULF5_004585 [Escherichia coli]|uniref:hypothetical protein n=1 Tax=Escherichia coli TaxID=562 RepID=UPI0012877857|nr:hypothetical protein [Escherichia coli]EBS3878947.1 hypothetical protein [Salmonella enterica subsp. enterica serovar Virchow]ECY7826504.1 hypothetical protein [Salmonella enterica subsp. enterica serovar Typhimurium]EHE7365072.1 hypothetical protein [Salmonella enterica subsp. enterica serovar Enteritidis]EHF3441776.1 hypothetical protein [Salmonella enterica]EHG5695512.1 hypothetical protein [Salmonella enterica subsp. enterica serovar Strathcona]EKN6333865.1 hypothetical protein [Yersin
MKLKSMIFTAALLLTGCASQSQVEQLTKQVNTLKTDMYNLQIQQRNDTKALQREVQKSRPIGVCYLDGQPYSQGAVIAGRICASNGVIVNDRPAEVSWQVYHRR